MDNPANLPEDSLNAAREIGAKILSELNVFSQPEKSTTPEKPKEVSDEQLLQNALTSVARLGDKLSDKDLKQIQKDIASYCRMADAAYQQREKGDGDRFRHVSDRENKCGVRISSRKDGFEIGIIVNDEANRKTDLHSIYLDAEGKVKEVTRYSTGGIRPHEVEPSTIQVAIDALKVGGKKK